MAYIDRIIGYITGYVDFALNAVCSLQALTMSLYMYVPFQIKNEVGRCRPLTAAYTGLHITFCSETLDGLVSLARKPMGGVPTLGL